MVANAEREQTAEVAAQQRLSRLGPSADYRPSRADPALKPTFDDFMVHGL
jgi:hypothetical protein